MVPHGIAPDTNTQLNEAVEAHETVAFLNYLKESAALLPGMPEVDYKCDLHVNCPGRVDWVAQYLQGYSSFDQPWWGWVYKAGSHDAWINSVDANSGNIL